MKKHVLTWFDHQKRTKKRFLGGWKPLFFHRFWRLLVSLFFRAMQVVWRTRSTTPTWVSFTQRRAEFLPWAFDRHVLVGVLFYFLGGWGFGFFDISKACPKVWQNYACALPVEDVVRLGSLLSLLGSSFPLKNAVARLGFEADSENLECKYRTAVDGVFRITSLHHTLVRFSYFDLQVI